MIMESKIVISLQKVLKFVLLPNKLLQHALSITTLQTWHVFKFLKCVLKTCKWNGIIRNNIEENFHSTKKRMKEDNLPRSVWYNYFSEERQVLISWPSATAQLFNSQRIFSEHFGNNLFCISLVNQTWVERNLKFLTYDQILLN